MFNFTQTHKISILVCFFTFAAELARTENIALNTPIRVLVLKHSKEKMADDDAKMILTAIAKSEGKDLDVKSIGNHFIHETKKIRVCLKKYEAIPNLKNFIDDEIKSNKHPDSTLIVFTIGHGSASGHLHNLGDRSELQLALAEVAEKNDQKILWWQLSCYSAAKLVPIESLSPKQKELLSILNTSDEKTTSPAYIEGQIMEKMFASIINGDMDEDGNQEINGTEFKNKMNQIKKGRGDLFITADFSSSLFGISWANRLKIIDIATNQELKFRSYIPVPNTKR